MIVVDASVLTDFLLGRRETHVAVEDELGDRSEEPLHAPELVEPEVLNALRRLLHRRSVSAEQAEAAVADLGRTRLARYPHAPLRERVWDLRHNLTAYDALYLSLAEALDARLLTADEGLASQARSILGRERVRLVG